MPPRYVWVHSAILGQEMRTPVLRPARLRLCKTDRALLPVADRRDSHFVDPVRDEILQRRLRATIAEGEVVLIGTPLIAVPLDEDQCRRIRSHPVDVRVEPSRRVRPDVGLV